MNLGIMTVHHNDPENFIDDLEDFFQYCSLLLCGNKDNKIPKNTTQSRKTCSKKFRKTIVSIGGHFYHFRDLVLCYAKCLQFCLRGPQEHIVTVQKILYCPMLSFLLMMDLVVPFASHKTISHCDCTNIIFDGC